MTSVLFRADIMTLRPADELAVEYMRKLKHDEVVRVEIKRVRSPQQHRKWWVLMTLIHGQQEEWPTVEALSKAVLCAIGHGDVVTSESGVKWLKPKSIAFGNLDQDQFNEIFDRAIKLVCERIVPGLADADVRQAVMEMCGA